MFIMKFKPHLFTVLAGMLFLNITVFSQSGSRELKSFDDNWKFKRGDYSGAKDPSYDDSSWRLLDLPHDWSIECDFDENLASCTGYLPAGFGWYRKSFSIPESYKGKSITISFDGVYCDGEVWINGKYVGKRPYGYISYYYNITPFIEFGKQNVIAVRVDHRKYADTRWYSGSGIYRHVWLTLQSNIHVAHWGTLVRSTLSGADRADIQIRTTISNDNKTSREITLSSLVYSQQGSKVASAVKNVILGNDSLITVNQEISLDDPVLWDIENPCMYTLKTRISSGETILDEYDTPFGIRSIRFDADKGFFLNGRNIKIKGVCLHHDGGSVGAAVPEKIWQIRLEKLKASGCNAIRTSHNPVAPEFLDLCDQIGFLVLDEAFDEWEYPKRKWIDGWNQTRYGDDGYPDIFQWCRQDLTDMVRRDWNHPSIIIWSIGNEVDYQNDPYADPESSNYTPDKPDVNRIPVIARSLVKVVKELDTSRPVTMAMANVRSSNKAGLPEVLDITGYNYTESAYQADHKKYPGRIIFGSENSHNYSAWLAVKNNDFISAQFLWTGADYLGEAGKFPSHTANSGLLDLASQEKPLYYWRQAMWSDKPMIYLAARKKRISDKENTDPMSRLAGFLNTAAEKEHWNYSKEDTVVVMAYTNCPEAELFLNGKSLGKKHSVPENSCIWWYVPYESGKVEAETTGTDGKLYKAELKTVSDPVEILLNPDVTHLKAGRREVALIEVQLTDKDKNPALLADNLIQFEIRGPGRIIGVDNGNPVDLTNYKKPERKAYNGRCLVIIQSNGQKGKITLTAGSEGLPEIFADIVIE